jgi:hypothetical protein
MRCHIVHSQGYVADNDHRVSLLVFRTVHNYVARGSQNIEVTVTNIFDNGDEVAITTFATASPLPRLMTSHRAKAWDNCWKVGKSPAFLPGRPARLFCCMTILTI